MIRKVMDLIKRKWRRTIAVCTAAALMLPGNMAYASAGDGTKTEGVIAVSEETVGTEQADTVYTAQVADAGQTDTVWSAQAADMEQVDTVYPEQVRAAASGQTDPAADTGTDDPQIFSGGVEDEVIVADDSQGESPESSAEDSAAGGMNEWQAATADAPDTIDLSECMVSVQESSFTYTGEEIRPVVSVFYKETLPEEETEEKSAGQEVGEEAEEKPAEAEDIEESGENLTETEDGQAAEESTETKLLTEGEDYQVTYAENVNAGTAEIILVGIGAYSGTRTETFTIKPRSISKFTVGLSYTSYTYNRKEHKPKVTLKWGSIGLTLKTDYKKTYSNNINVGKGTVTITGIGNYCGTIKKTFTIKQKSISSLTGKLSYKTTTYSGKRKKPGVKIKQGDSRLVAGKDYKVSYANNKHVGKATVTIKGKGNYKGTLKLKFTILPKKTAVKSLTSSFRSIIVKWSKNTEASGYEICYSTSASFKNCVKVKIKSGSTTSKRISGLSAGKKYYFKIRAFKGKFKSKWCKKRSKTVYATSNIDYVNWAISIANNNAVGYGHYWGPNPNYPVSISCAGLVGMALTLNGYGDFRTYGKTPYDWMYWDNTMSDATYRQKLRECGFQQIPFTGVSNLQPGDILYSVAHTGIYVGNGASVEARGSGAQHWDSHGLWTGNTYADDDGIEIAVYPCPSSGWECVFRMRGW